MKACLKPACLAAALLLALAACKRETPSVSPAPPADAGAPVAAPAAEGDAAAAVELKDVIETTDRYIIGISYPPAVNKYPGLAQAVADYSQAARAELMQAVDGLGNDKPSAPYELSLSYQLLLETPQLVTVSADGSSYTGGAHGQPLVGRFVWLPQQEKLLTADELLPTADGFIAVSNYAREQLHTAVSLRVEADDLPPIERAQLVKTADKMIDEGTRPDAGNFGQFQPLLGADGKISALRFVFPPYQVGPYSDGTQTVDVPASVLLPHVAPKYVDLFAKE
ncbi:PdaC/SigV domain-containing protein [Pseudoxanthomonas wuyuanensis]